MHIDPRKAVGAHGFLRYQAIVCISSQFLYSHKYKWDALTQTSDQHSVCVAELHFINRHRQLQITRQHEQKRKICLPLIYRDQVSHSGLRCNRNLRKRKTLDQLLLVAVGEEPVDPQDARLNGTRHFVQAHLEDFRAELTVSVDGPRTCGFDGNVGGGGGKE